MEKGLIRKVIAGTAVAGVLYFAGDTIFNRDKFYLSPNDFSNARWERVDNEDGMIWDDYTESGIPQNGPNWTGYNIEMKKKNPNGFGGKICRPIFDNKNQNN